MVGRLDAVIMGCRERIRGGRPVAWLLTMITLSQKESFTFVVYLVQSKECCILELHPRAATL